MKRITKSTLQNCKINFNVLNALCREYNSDISKLIIEMLEFILQAPEEINVQLYLNSLESIEVLTYFDESIATCEDNDELFGQSISTNSNLNDSIIDIADDCGIIDIDDDIPF